MGNFFFSGLLWPAGSWLLVEHGSFDDYKLSPYAIAKASTPHLFFSSPPVPFPVYWLIVCEVRGASLHHVLFVRYQQ